MKELVRVWQMLKPFHKDFRAYVFLTVILEAIQVSRSYVFPFGLLMLSWNVPTWQWALVFAALLVYYEGYIRCDTNVDWIIVNRVTGPVERYLKLRAQEVFMRMDLAWHQDNNSGTLVGKVNQGSSKVHEVVMTVCWEFFPTSIQTVWSLVMLTFLCWYVAPIVIVSFACFMWVCIIADRVKRPLRKERHDLYEKEWAKSVENVHSIATSLAFGQTERQLRDFTSLTDRILNLFRRERRTSIFIHTRWKLRTLLAGEGLVWVVLIYQVYRGHISHVNAFFVWTLCQRLFTSFGRFANLMEVTNEATESTRRLANLLAQSPSIYDRAGVQNVDHASVGIELRDVRFSYDKNGETEAIRGVSLNIRPGEIIALVGPSGSGKTTLPKLFSRKFEISSGEILVCGKKVNEWPLGQLRALFSVVPQADDVFMFDATISDNISFSRPEADLEEIEEAAYKAGLMEDMKIFHLGLHTVVGERGVKLSGGQKQRLALARAFLANQRPVLILDEPTSAVDAQTEEIIQGSLKEILADKTAIIIAHRLATIWDIADRIVVLEHGRIKEVGTPKELMALNGLYAKMFRLQTRAEQLRAEAEAIEVEVLS
jgi:ABC-type multidrug transport system fused ATPase/permease subunit